MNRLVTALCGLALLLASLLPSPPVAAHASSSAWLDLVANAEGAELRWDLALRDADLALDLDQDGDGQLRWGEVRLAEDALYGYAAERLLLSGADRPCTLSPAAPVQIADRLDGRYAVLRLRAVCDAAPRLLRYQALFDLDAAHRLLVRVRAADGEHSALLGPGEPELSLGGGPAPARLLAQYFREGVGHVLGGWDHLLFLAGLFLPAVLRRQDGRWLPAPSLRPVLIDALRLVTAFTLAHALTLALAALGWLSLPSRWVESAVAASVLFTGLNNLRPMVGARLVWLAAVFGLIHGTAIAGALLELGLPAEGRVLALLGFNLGVELAQLTLVAAFLPLAYLARRSAAYRWALLWPGSVLVALAGAIWLVDRAFDLGWPLPI